MLEQLVIYFIVQIIHCEVEVCIRNENEQTTDRHHREN